LKNRGQFVIFEGLICNFLKTHWGQFEKYKDQNAKFEIKM